MAENYAIIIAIENYRDKRINKVSYALNDANEFKKLLIKDFNVAPINIYSFLDNDATKTSLENEIPYFIRNLEEEDKLYFYYAGHGFSNNSHNYLTAWDTSSLNLLDTSISLQSTILSMILNSKCSKSLLFLDACANQIKGDIHSRDIVSDMNPSEFKDFMNSAKYSATFLSCSPKEKSYSSQNISHGVWTYHLLKALSGEEKKAIYKNRFVTDASLKDYLAVAVPRYIREKMSIRATQTPQAIITSTNTFEIREIIEKAKSSNPDFPQFKLNASEIYLRNFETNNFQNLPGFSKRKNHFIPEDFNRDSVKFVQKMMEEEIGEEIKEVYENCKKYLNLKRSEINKETLSDGGTIDTEYFRFNMFATQSNVDPGQYCIYRILSFRKSLDELPSELENVFPNNFNEVVIPISGEIDFDKIVDKLEDFKSINKGNLFENDTSGEIKYKFKNGIEIKINAVEGEFSLDLHKPLELFEFLTASKEYLISLFGNNIKLII